MKGRLAKATGAFTETEIDDEVVVMNLSSGEFFSLTQSARSIWQLLDGTRDREALLTDLAAEYAVSTAEIEQDVDDFLSELTSAGLLISE